MPLSDYFTIGNTLYGLSVVASYVGGYLTNVLSGPHTESFKGWVQSGDLRKLLQLGREEVIIVLPHQTESKSRELPQIAVEDALALKNVFEILGDIGVKHPKIRHPSNLSESDRKRNIISIGGSMTNSFTAEVLELPLADGKLDFKRSETHPDQVVLKRGDSITYTSPSYASPRPVNAQDKIPDIGFILRRPNPRNPVSTILVLAGIRGRGTWGASDHLRKNAKKLHARVKKDGENALDRGFLAVLDVDYENFDITRTRIKDISSVCDDV